MREELLSKERCGVVAFMDYADTKIKVAACVSNPGQFAVIISGAILEMCKNQYWDAAEMARCICETVIKATVKGKIK